MKVLSLFDGISACHLALTRAGIEVDTYYTAEIDKYATQISEHHYPDAIRFGDVTKWQEWDIDWSSIDLVTGGFPCQAWSVAGKQLGDKDERGMLFWTMLDIMKMVLKHNPKAYFLMENVKMKREFEEYITHHTEQALGQVEKHLINSALVSAQNRNRYYWTNIQGITQPEDKGLVLDDIIESDIESVLSDKEMDYMLRSESTTSHKPRIDRARKPDEKANTLTQSMHKGVPHGVIERPCEPREFKADSLCHHAATATDLNGNESIKRVYAETGKAPTLTTMGGGHREPKVLNSEITYRKLTPLECERLQTFPDDWTLVTDENGKQLVSKTQRYKALGNAWTVDVIAHIFNTLHIQINPIA